MFHHLKYALFLLLTTASLAAQAQSYVSFERQAAYLPLVAAGKSLPLLVSADDCPGVVRAATDLQQDLARVTGQRPALLRQAAQAKGAAVVIIGTIGKSPLMATLIRQKKLDVSGVQGKWESSVTQVVANPLPGVAQALVIAGSDRRGTIYGIYELWQQVGVSPCYWWADVPVAHHAAMYVRPGRYLIQEPKVKYRGIFINDEAPAFSGGANHQVYEHRVYLPEAGPVNLLAYVAPTIDFRNEGGLAYAVAFDDEAPQLVNISAKSPASRGSTTTRKRP